MLSSGHGRGCRFGGDDEDITSEMYPAWSKRIKREEATIIEFVRKARRGDEREIRNSFSRSTIEFVFLARESASDVLLPE